ncbi:hypothetical protein L0152_31035 [bacterium]|nr:hypothetical protein [bacterium]
MKRVLRSFNKFADAEEADWQYYASLSPKERPDIMLVENTFTQPEKVIQLGRPPSRIDLLTSITGVTFDEAWAS